MRVAPTGLALITACSASCAFASGKQECVAAKLDPSVNIIEQMNSHSLNLSQPRAISQLFLGPDKKLKAAATELRKFGYTIQESAHGRLVAIAKVAVTAAWVHTAVPQMCATAEKASVDYDGWDVDVAADHIRDTAER